jgi:hypothetical protein
MSNVTQFTYDEAHPEISHHLVSIVLELHRADAERGFIAHHQSRIDRHLPNAGQFSGDLGSASRAVKRHAEALFGHAANLVAYEQNISEHWTSIRKLVSEDIERLELPKEHVSSAMMSLAEKVHALVKDARRELAEDSETEE